MRGSYRLRRQNIGILLRVILDNFLVCLGRVVLDMSILQCLELALNTSTEMSNMRSWQFRQRSSEPDRSEQVHANVLRICQLPDGLGFKSRSTRSVPCARSL